MRSRRFMLLAATLVALNVALWVVPQGLALQRVVVSTLFGKSMVRAEVIESNGADWKVDRGVVVANSALSNTLTVREADGTVQPITTSSSTKVTFAGTALKLRAVRPGWHVLVTWPAPSGPADSVLVEKKHA